MAIITGTHFNYHQVCRRKLWLFSAGITMEHTSDLVYEGKLIHETTYQQRPERYQELELDGIKIDFYDAKNRVVHEVKKSNKYRLPTDSNYYITYTYWSVTEYREQRGYWSIRLCEKRKK